MDLFEAGLQAQIEREQPLAARLRPRTLDEFIGQDHILGPGRLLRRAIQADQLSSLIFYGPPGTGKTTLATVIANTSCPFLGCLYRRQSTTNDQHGPNFVLVLRQTTGDLQYRCYGIS